MKILQYIYNGENICPEPSGFYNKFSKGFRKTILYTVLICPLYYCSSCKKLIETSPPISSITTSQVFADSSDARAAILGIYTNMINSGQFFVSFGSGTFTIICGSSADELLPYPSNGDQFSINKLIATNGNVPNLFWNPGYQYLYQANAIIAGLNASTTISLTAKKQFIAEAEFLRAFINFYMVNIYGNIPLITSVNYHTTESVTNTPKAQVYQAIINDLTDAENVLPADYSAGGGQRIRANKWAAKALLARVYLYNNDWNNAFSQSNAIINNTGLFNLADSLNGVFLANSPEAILQWQISSASNTYNYNSTPEGYLLIPFFPTRPPAYYCTPELLSAFEPGDLRKTDWIDSTLWQGVTYYYPYKYKNGPLQAQPNAAVTEYYMVLRLAEQYLIRAEAEVNSGTNGGTIAAIKDLNIIRNRAGLPSLSPGLTKTEAIAAVAHERQIELFAEWGHRWFDLKRTGTAHSVLSVISYKQPWAGDYQLLYPIAESEIQADPNLKQNPGY